MTTPSGRFVGGGRSVDIAMRRAFHERRWASAGLGSGQPRRAVVLTSERSAARNLRRSRTDRASARKATAITVITVTRAAGSDYAVISKQVKAAGLLDRRPGYYSAKIVLTLAAYIIGWAVFWRIGDSWLQLFTAVALGVIFTQVAFLGHDAGHRQIVADRRRSDAYGLVFGNLLVGLAWGWWLDKHTRHHANPNHEDEDPDVNSAALAFTPDQAMRRRGALRRLAARTQAWLFFPMLTLEGLSLHVAGVRELLSGPARRYRRLETVLLVCNLIGYTALVLTVLSPLKTLAFVAVQQGVFGFYMGCSFAPNHKGMPILTASDELDYLRRQVLTSRNVRGNWLTDFVLGGLNYQIEHHLFPSMPRPNLRRVAPLVRGYCTELQLPYTETGLIASYVIVLRHLNAVGQPLRATAPS